MIGSLTRKICTGGRENRTRQRTSRIPGESLGLRTRNPAAKSSDSSSTLSCKTLRLARPLVVFGLTQAILFGGILRAQSAPLTSLHSVHSLSNEDANKSLPVACEATVVYSRGYEQLLFAQDGDAALFVRTPTNKDWTPGDRILIKGVTQGSFRPIILASDITLIRHDRVPKSVPATWSQMIRSQLDSRLVVVQAQVRAANLVTNTSAEVQSARLQLLMDGGHLEAYVDSSDERAVKKLLDSEVQITGVVAGKFDDKMEQTGIVLYVSSLADIKVLRTAKVDPWSLPVSPIEGILGESNIQDFTQRVRVDGTITYYQPGSTVVLQNGLRSIWISTETRAPLALGDFAEAIGFPTARDRLLMLTDGEVKDIRIATPIQPQRSTWKELAAWNSSKPNGHQYDLVSTEGTVVTEVRESSQDEYVLSSGGKLFSAIYRHPFGVATPPPMRQIPVGSTIRVTGVCAILDSATIIPGQDVSFDILLRSFDDIEILANPSVLNIRNLLLFSGSLLVLLMIGGLRTWIVERRVRHQNARAAFMERRRAAILEDINGSRPLTDILGDLTELVSFRLWGAPCWIEIVDGARLGNRPPSFEGFRTGVQQIRGRAGSVLGSVYAAFPAGSRANSQESEALAMAASLAALAFETRRLYADLTHRSDFDLLTEIHNRFSLEKYLEQQIEQARETAAVFGLIYIDLNYFKQVNDQFGHLVGDLYLREVALRMKHQLRGQDMLARLGGDEFAVLAPKVRNRGEVDEIVHRLERTFIEPFLIEGYSVQGSASFGYALYPEDGTSKDTLLSAADAAMYVAKQTKRQKTLR